MKFALITSDTCKTTVVGSRRVSFKAGRTGVVSCRSEWLWVSEGCVRRRRGAGGGRARPRRRGSRARGAAGGASPRAWWRGSCGRAPSRRALLARLGIWPGCLWSGTLGALLRRRRSFYLKQRINPSVTYQKLKIRSIKHSLFSFLETFLYFFSQLSFVIKTLSNSWYVSRIKSVNYLLWMTIVWLLLAFLFWKLEMPQMWISTSIPNDTSTCYDCYALVCVTLHTVVI